MEINIVFREEPIEAEITIENDDEVEKLRNVLDELSEFIEDYESEDGD